MKITVIEANNSQQQFYDITWKVTGGCYYHLACTACAFGALVNVPLGSCIDYREQFILAVSKQQLPCTFDTDDYPEVLI